MSGANGWLEASDNGSITAVNTFSLSLEFRQDINGSGGLLFGKHPLPFSGNTLEISVLLLNANRLLFAVGPLAAQSQAFLIGPTVTRGVWHTVRASWEVATGRLALEYDGMLMEKKRNCIGNEYRPADSNRQHGRKYPSIPWIDRAS